MWAKGARVGVELKQVQAMVGLKNYWDGDNLISPFGMFKWTVQNVSNDCIIPHLSLATSKEANLS